jgi:hypothetical protein
LGALGRRILRILLFPVFVPLFLLGWVIYFVGNWQMSKTAETKTKTSDRSLEEESPANDVDVEMGLSAHMEQPPAKSAV